MVLDDNNILQADATAIAGFLILLTIAYYFEPRSGEIVGKPGIWTAMRISRLVIAVVIPFSVSAILLVLGNLFDGSYTIALGYTITPTILGRYATMFGFGTLIIGIIWLLRHKATKSWVESQKG